MGRRQLELHTVPKLQLFRPHRHEFDRDPWHLRPDIPALHPELSGFLLAGGVMQQDQPWGQQDKKPEIIIFIETVSRDLDFMLQPKNPQKSPI